jgi:hypothetical protein
MDETQTALQALRELLDNPDRADWDKLAAASRALIRAIETGQPKSGSWRPAVVWQITCSALPLLTQTRPAGRKDGAAQGVLDSERNMKY